MSIGRPDGHTKKKSSKKVKVRAVKSGILGASTKRPKIVYPHKKIGKAKAISREAAEKLLVPETNAGSGRVKSTKDVTNYASREKAQASSLRPKIDKRASQLLHGYAERGIPHSEAVDYMVKLARRGKSRAALERAEAVFNEVGWTKSGSKRLRQVLTQDLVNEMLEERGK